MTETELKKLATTFAAGELDFHEYRKLRAQFLSNLAKETGPNDALNLKYSRVNPHGNAEGHERVQQDNAWFDRNGKPINALILAALIIFAVLGILFLFIK